MFVRFLKVKCRRKELALQIPRFVVCQFQELTEATFFPKGAQGGDSRCRTLVTEVLDAQNFWITLVSKGLETVVLSEGCGVLELVLSEGLEVSVLVVPACWRNPGYIYIYI